MTVASLKIGRREYVVIPRRREFERMRAELGAEAARDRADADEAGKRLKDPAASVDSVGAGEKAVGAGMTYRVEIKPAALQEIARLPKPDQRRVAQRIDALADHPRPPGCVKLAGVVNLWRIRAGDYRIIYTIDDAPLVVAVVKVGHRRDIYRRL